MAFVASSAAPPDSGPKRHPATGAREEVSAEVEAVAGIKGTTAEIWVLVKEGQCAS